MKKRFLLVGLAAMGTIAVSQKNVEWTEHGLNQEGTKQYLSKIAQEPSSEREVTCSDTSYYTVYKGSPQAEFPIVTDGLSFESVGQTYFNTSNLELKGIRFWYSNPGATAVDATIHIYSVDENNQPTERLAWANALTQPGLYQQGDFYFDEVVNVNSNFFVSIQALPNMGMDSLKIAYNNAGRGENLSHVGWHDGTSLGAWMSVLNDMGGDTDFMIFPIYDVDVTANISTPATAYEGANFDYQVNSTIINPTDSMVNFSYFFGAPQLYVDFYDANGQVEHQEFNTPSGNYSYSNAGNYSIGHAAVWFSWTTYWLDPQDPNFVPYYCFDQVINDIEILPLATGIDEMSYSVVGENVFLSSTFTGNYEVYSLSGAIVSQGRLNEEQSLTLSHLNQGLYVIRFRNEEMNFSVKMLK